MFSALEDVQVVAWHVRGAKSFLFNEIVVQAVWANGIMALAASGVQTGKAGYDQNLGFFTIPGIAFDFDDLASVMDT